MPLYQYACDCGKEQEQFFKMAEKPATVPCECGGVAKKVLSAGMVIGDDMPPWMRHPETLGCLQCSGEKTKIKTRSDYNRYLKEHNVIERSAKHEV
jgi:putative FmdB family regulatory protein